MSKAQLIFPVVMGGTMAFFITAVITFMNVGLPPDFLVRWMRAFAVAWPLAALAASFAAPFARRVTDRIVARLDG